MRQVGFVRFCFFSIQLFPFFQFTLNLRHKKKKNPRKRKFTWNNQLLPISCLQICSSSRLSIEWISVLTHKANSKMISSWEAKFYAKTGCKEIITSAWLFLLVCLFSKGQTGNSDNSAVPRKFWSGSSFCSFKSWQGFRLVTNIKKCNKITDLV